MVKLVQIVPAARASDPPTEIELGPFDSEDAAAAKARELSDAWIKEHGRKPPWPTYRIEHA